MRRLTTIAALGALLMLSPALSHPVRADDCPDAWITAKVKTRLMGKSGFGAFKIEVDTDECVVALSGCVDTEARRAEAESVARQVKRVHGVSNRLTLCPAKSSSAPEKPAECPDAMITAEVKSLILAKEGMTAFKINVDTEECVVTLNGCVDTDARRSQAAEAARKGKWVSGVENRLGLCSSK